MEKRKWNLFIILFFVFCFLIFLSIYICFKKDYILIRYNNEIDFKKLKDIHEKYTISYQIKYKKNIKIQEEENVYNIIFTNSDLFEIIKINIIDGLVTDKDDFFIIPSSLSKKYYGNNTPVGSYVELADKLYKITGVYKEKLYDKNPNIYTNCLDITTDKIHITNIYLKPNVEQNSNEDELSHIQEFLDIEFKK